MRNLLLMMRIIGIRGNSMPDPVKQYIALKIAEHVAGVKTLSKVVDEIVEFMNEIYAEEDGEELDRFKRD